MRKSLTMLAFLMVLLSALACNVSSDDVDFVICDRTGGEWVVPEGSIDGWCRYPDNEQTQQREGSGKKKGDEPDAPPEEQVPVGTYIGDNGEIPPDWELVEAEFTIEVAEDGTIEGSRIYVIKMDSVGATCTWRRENGHATSISGHMTGANGTATVENESYTVSDSSECGGSNNHDTFESVCDEAQIAVSGEQMEISGGGSPDCGFVFTATRQ